MDESSALSEHGEGTGVSLATLDSLPLPAVVVDSESLITWRNSEAARLFGEPAGERSDFTHLLPQLRALDGTSLPADDFPTTRALRGSPVEGEVFRHRGTGGEERLVKLWSATLPGPIRDTVLVIWEDVTAERRSAELHGALNRIHITLSGAGVDVQVLDNVLEDARQALSAAGASIAEWLPADDSERSAGLEVGAPVVVTHSCGQGVHPPKSVLAGKQAELAMTVKRSRETLVVENAVKDTRLADTGLGVQPGALIMTPLVSGGRVRGVITFSFLEGPRPFPPAERDFISNLAALIALWVERAELQHRTEVELSRSSMLHNVTLAASSELEVEAQAREILRALAVHLNARAGDLKIFDAGRNALRVVASFGFPEGGPRQDMEVDVASREQLSALAVRRRRIVTHEDDPRAAERLPALARLGLAGARYLSSPILNEGRVVGELWLVFSGLRSFSEQELLSIQAVSNAIGQAIAGAGMYQQIKQSAELEDALNRIHSSLSSSLDPDEIMRRVMVMGRRALGADWAQLSLREGEGWVVRRLMKDSLGFTVEEYEEDPLLCAQEARRIRNVHVCEHAEGEEAAQGEPSFEKSRAGLSAPLIVRDEVSGVISFHFRRPVRSSSAQLDFVRKLAAAAAIYLENSRLFDQQARAARLSDALNTIDAHISSSLSSDDIMRRVVVEATDALNCESCAIHVQEGNHWVVHYAHGFAYDVIGHRFSDEQMPFAAQAAKEKRVVAIADAWSDERAQPTIMRAYGIRSVLAAPLTTGGSTYGVASFNYHTAPARFSPEQIDFVRKLSTSVSLALENASLYQEKAEVAEKLQQGFSVQPEAAPDVEFGHAYLSATEAARVGGDFYDVFPLGPSKVGVVIGDVSGHGVSAAALAYLVRTAFFAYAVDDPDPSVVMTRTNRILIQRTDPDVFSTAFFAVLDTSSGTLTSCSAGHPPALLRRAGGEVEMLEEVNLPLGVRHAPPFESHRTNMEMGDLLLLYTDGVLDARRGNDFFGEAHLLELLEHPQPGWPCTLPQQIIQEVLDFSGGVLLDDVAVVAVKRVEPKEDQ